MCALVFFQFMSYNRRHRISSIHLLLWTLEKLTKFKKKINFHMFIIVKVELDCIHTEPFSMTLTLTMYLGMKTTF